MSIKDRTQEARASIDNAVTGKSNNHWWRLVVLVAGDVVVFFVFAVIGRRSHNEATNLLQPAITALPFAAAWFLVAPFIGAFKRGLEQDTGKFSLRTFLAWLAAWPVSMLFRGVFVDKGVPPWTFALITLVSNAILLQIWRVPYSLIFRKR